MEGPYANSRAVLCYPAVARFGFKHRERKKNLLAFSQLQRCGHPAITDSSKTPGKDKF